MCLKIKHIYFHQQCVQGTDENSIISGAMLEGLAVNKALNKKVAKLSS